MATHGSLDLVILSGDQHIPPGHTFGMPSLRPGYKVRLHAVCYFRKAMHKISLAYVLYFCIKGILHNLRLLYSSCIHVTRTCIHIFATSMELTCKPSFKAFKILSMCLSFMIQPYHPILGLNAALK